MAKSGRLSLRMAAMVAALGFGLSGCEYIVEQECGPEPAYKPDQPAGGFEHESWVRCQENIEGFITALVFTAVAIGAAAAVVAAGSSGGGGGGEGRGPPVGV
jgi:hypothetical protein